MTKKIFISYKRNDSPIMAGRLCDNLQSRFGKKQVFYDITTLNPGEEFEPFIKNYILKSKILLAVIGPNWHKNFQTKTDKITDFVAFEIATALQNNVKVIPVLLEDTKMPSAGDLPENMRGLTGKNAFTIHNNSFNTEIEILSTYIRKYLNEKKDYGKIIKYTSVFILACLVAFITYFFWPKAEMKKSGGYREITQINSQEPQISMNWSTIQTVTSLPKKPASLALQNNAILFVSKLEEDDNLGFFYLIKPGTPQQLFFYKTGNKLFINQKLKALYIDKNEKLTKLSNEEIASLETISIALKEINDTLFNQLSEILQVNRHISVIDNLVLVGSDSLFQISESIYQLMKMTKPEILVCATSFQEIATLDLTSVKSAIIMKAPNTSVNFYRSLVMPGLKSLTSFGTETSKILLGDSTESITYINDSSFKNLPKESKDRIRQLQLIFIKDDISRTIDFAGIKDYKNLKSFGYYNTSDVKNPTIDNIESIKGMTDLIISKVTPADISILAKNNPNLQHLTASFKGDILNLDWVSPFKHLKSLSLDISSDSVFRDYQNVEPLSKLPKLEYFGINYKVDRGSKSYENIISACPKCNIYYWGVCLGSGWLLLFFPMIGLLLIVKLLQSKANLNWPDSSNI